MDALRPLHVALVVGEHSGDQLGFKLMQALRQRLGADGVRFSGTAGEAMEREGMTSLFPLGDIAVMGILPVVARFPTLLRRGYAVVDAIVADPPDVLVIIDSPDFTHAVARRVRRRLPGLPIIDYVSPTVWAWRPGRARAMRAYVDHLLALLPFEPAAHAELGGPPCPYVGHPLIERLAELRPGTPDEVAARAGEPPLLLVLPGSRRSEIRRLLGPFGNTVAQVAASHSGPVDVVVPAVAPLEADLPAGGAAWPAPARIDTGESAKRAAFRRARAALAASGTVSLELALARVPMVIAYRVSKLEEQLKYIIRASSIVLPNLVLGEKFVPEFLQGDAEPGRLAATLLPLLNDGPARAAQLAGFARVEAAMVLPPGETPSGRAANVILAAAGR